MKEVSAVEFLAVCLNHCDLVFISLKHLCLIHCVKTSPGEVTFSGYIQSALNITNCYRLLIVCVLKIDLF